MKKKYEFIAQIRVRFDADLDCEENQNRRYRHDASDIAGMIVSAYCEAMRNNNIEVNCDMPVGISWVGHLGNTQVSESMPNRHHQTVFNIGEVVSATSEMRHWNLHGRFFYSGVFDDAELSRFRFLAEKSPRQGYHHDIVSMPEINNLESISEIIRDVRDQISVNISENFRQEFQKRILEYIEGQVEDGLIRAEDSPTL